MLAIQNLSCKRGYRTLFKEINFAVNTGECAYIAGENGSGKSSLLKQLCGLLPVETGHITWQSKAINTVTEAFQQDLLYLGHHNGLKQDLTPLENLQFYAAMDNTQCDEQQLIEQLNIRGLGKCMKLPVMRLSQGQKKRVALTRLTLSNKPLWILDEPFSDLDQAAIDLLTQDIDHHLQQKGMLVVTSHQAMDIGAPQQTIRLSH